jgi:molecular chaperone HscB
MVNFFDVLGISPGYKIDEKALLENYLRSQRLAHPDMVESSSNESVLLNAAYNALSNPVDRAMHLLDIHGRNVDTLDPEFAAEAFGIREKYDSLRSSEDKNKFCDELSERVHSLTLMLYDLENNLDEFQKYFSLLRFVRSFLQKVRSDVYRGD